MADGRKNNGGARPGAGRKRKADELELMNLLNTAWPLAERRAAIERLVELSKAGVNSLDAIKLLLAYTYGKPVERQEVSGPDGGPIPVREVTIEVPSESLDPDRDT